jgi:hypothetical protein
MCRGGWSANVQHGDQHVVQPINGGDTLSFQHSAPLRGLELGANGQHGDHRMQPRRARDRNATSVLKRLVDFGLIPASITTIISLFCRVGGMQQGHE